MTSIDVVQIVPQMGVGGMERGVLELCAALDRAGLRALVVSSGGPWVSTLDAMGVPHQQLPVADAKQLAAASRHLGALLERVRPKVLHARSRIPRRVAYRAARSLSKRPLFVVTAHSFRDAEEATEPILEADRVITVSSALRQRLQERLPLLEAERLVTIPPGVDVEHFRPGHQPDPAWVERHQLQRFREAPCISLIGRMSEWKGHHRFLRLLALLRREVADVRGLLVGPAPEAHHRTYRRHLERSIRWRRLSRHARILDAELEIRNVYAVSDVVVSMSHDPPETFGRTPLEALSMGVPIAGYAHGGTAEYAFGLFPEGAAPPLDDRTLAKRILRILRERPKTPEIPAPLTVRAACAAVLETYRRVDSK